MDKNHLNKIDYLNYMKSEYIDNPINPVHNTMYNNILSGDTFQLNDLYNSFVNDNRITTSDNPLIGRKYLFVSYVSIIMYVCSLKGVEYNKLYTVGTMYLQLMDKCTSETEIFVLYKKMLSDFVDRIYKENNNTIYSQLVEKSIQYINCNLHNNISIEDISRHINLSPSYFSSKFKKEVGLSVAKYILNKRIETAKNMLKYSDYSYNDICECLSFCSQSHFINSFKNIVGITPREYRIKYFRDKWI